MIKAYDDQAVAEVHMVSHEYDVIFTKLFKAIKAHRLIFVLSAYSC